LDSGASLGLLTKVAGGRDASGFVVGLSAGYRKVLKSRLTLTATAGVLQMASSVYTGVYPDLAIGVGKSF
jgi:hypothetical protein